MRQSRKMRCFTQIRRFFTMGFVRRWIIAVYTAATGFEDISAYPAGT